jgi:2Fe-2S ferredoxin
LTNQTVLLTFFPQGISVSARPGDTILDAALDNGIDLPHECGGNCACTTCHVAVEAGGEHLSLIEEVEAERLETAENRTASSRLGCQALLQGGDVTVTIVEIW